MTNVFNMLCVHLMCTHCSFDATRNKLNCYRSNDFVWEDFANT